MLAHAWLGRPACSIYSRLSVSCAPEHLSLRSAGLFVKQRHPTPLLRTYSSAMSSSSPTKKLVVLDLNGTLVVRSKFEGSKGPRGRGGYVSCFLTSSLPAKSTAFTDEDPLPLLETMICLAYPILGSSSSRPTRRLLTALPAHLPQILDAPFDAGLARFHGLELGAAEEHREHGRARLPG